MAKQLKHNDLFVLLEQFSCMANLLAPFLYLVVSQL
jgi:hypothetical protein